MKSLIVVVKKPSEEAQVAQMDDRLEAMQKLVGGYIERISGCAMGMSTEGSCIDMYSNECAKIIGSAPNLWIFDRFDQVCGTCFFVGGDDTTGDIRSLTDAEVSLALGWCKENSVTNTNGVNKL